ncbi:MAG: (2Fe-2S)-binding protein [Gemmataceae bacterium]|nr:(2Fe-2S)-binding protein [Gemmataceae bacterium]
MDSTFEARDCSACPSRLVCRCLQVTEDALLAALDAGGIQTLRDLRRCTGAGDGCTACHRQLKTYLERRTALAMA